jgi:uncharacterized membrane protein YfcA
VHDSLVNLWSWLDVEAWQLAAAIAAATIGGIISGLTGFGFGLVVVPILLMLFPPPTVVVLSKGLGVSSGLPILWADWRIARARIIATLIFPALIGLLVGIWILTTSNPAVIKFAAGLTVIVFAMIVLRGFVIPGIRSRIAPVVVGFTSGALGTSTGMPGPPAVLYLTDKNLEPRVFRSSITMYFFVIDIIGVALVVRTGIVEDQVLGIALILLPFALLGRRVGQRFLPRVDRAQFRQITLTLLVVTGLSAMITAIVGSIG